MRSLISNVQGATLHSVNILCFNISNVRGAILHYVNILCFNILRVIISIAQLNLLQLKLLQLKLLHCYIVRAIVSLMQDITPIEITTLLHSAYHSFTYARYRYTFFSWP